MRHTRAGDVATVGVGTLTTTPGVQGSELERVNGRVVLRLTTIGDLLIEVAMSVEEPDTANGSRRSLAAFR